MLIVSGIKHFIEQYLMQNTKACGEISFFLETTKKKDRFLSRSCVFAKNRRREDYEVAVKAQSAINAQSIIKPQSIIRL